jgi:hypothetical protein
MHNGRSLSTFMSENLKAPRENHQDSCTSQGLVCFELHTVTHLCVLPKNLNYAPCEFEQGQPPASNILVCATYRLGSLELARIHIRIPAHGVSMCLFVVGPLISICMHHVKVIQSHWCTKNGNSSLFHIAL